MKPAYPCLSFTTPACLLLLALSGLPAQASANTLEFSGTTNSLPLPCMEKTG